MVKLLCATPTSFIFISRNVFLSGHASGRGNSIIPYFITGYQKFAVSLDPECTQRSFNEVLNRMGIASLTHIEYARKSEFLKILKAVVAESRAAAESGADNGVA